MSQLTKQLEGSLALEPVREEVMPTPMGMLQLAISKGADIDQLTKLMELQERFEANEARRAFNAAMAKFKANPPKINKNNPVSFGTTKYSHATLDHVTDMITPALSAVGISHKWAVGQKDQIAVTCILTHQLGHSEMTTLRAAPDSSGSKNPIQAIGSTVTYLERYTLLAATGMAAAGTDNDGNTASDSKHLDHEERDRFIGLIEGARTHNDLKDFYMDALKAAKEAGDDAATKAFVEATAKRKKELA